MIKRNEADRSEIEGHLQAYRQQVEAEPDRL
ncbi:MAG: hypothetical protein ETSY1_42215 [Candidatus Entotheonella factor]|uniref:Uncharacterized protein n=1 Tax=Entotheonella factor TaxID=1429438 RepID=W4L539_ENTF1|nr:MAG: hypothetical protein ETSY1_42215 [Candidatus Entotheonella factor]